jgi:signal transduction histidine kinase
MTIGAAEESRAQAALLHVAMLVVRGAPPDALFAAVAEQAARLLGGEASAVLRFVGAERAVVVGVWRAGGTRGMPVNAELDFGATNSALGRARSTRLPARADSYEGLRGELPMTMRSIGLRSSVAAPVLLEEDPWGAVVVSTTRAEPLPAESEERMGEFADLLGRALENAAADRRLADSRHALVEAADEARRRLERDLHEGAQQHLVAAALKLRVARSRAPEGSELAALIEDALAEAIEAGGSLRELARGLHPAVLTERGLAAAVQALATRSGLAVHLRELPARRFAPTIESTAYFVVSEALANVAAHAPVAEVTVQVADRVDRLVVEVADDGAGGADPEGGNGLRALANRAAAVGGSFDVASPHGGGTTVRAELPVSE